MDQSQRELRRSAADAFMESLDQLENSLQFRETETAQPTSPPMPNIQPKDPDSKIDVKALEDAAADIEQFIQSREIQSREKGEG